MASSNGRTPQPWEVDSAARPNHNFSGAVPSTVIPSGRPSSRPGGWRSGRQHRRGGHKQTTTLPLAKAGTRMTVTSTPGVQPGEPPGCQLADGFVRSQSEAIPLSTYPFTARKVQRNPIQNGGCNEGNGSAMECLSYSYQ